MSARSRAHPWFRRGVAEPESVHFEDVAAARAVRHFEALWGEEVARTPWLKEALAGYEIRLEESPWCRRALGRWNVEADVARVAELMPEGR